MLESLQESASTSKMYKTASAFKCTTAWRVSFTSSVQSCKLKYLKNHDQLLHNYDACAWYSIIKNSTCHCCCFRTCNLHKILFWVDNMYIIISNCGKNLHCQYTTHWHYITPPQISVLHHAKHKVAMHALPHKLERHIIQAMKYYVYVIYDWL